MPSSIIFLMEEVPDDEFLFSLNLRLVDKFKSKTEHTLIYKRLKKEVKRNSVVNISNDYLNKIR